MVAAAGRRLKISYDMCKDVKYTDYLPGGIAWRTDTAAPRLRSFPRARNPAVAIIGGEG